MKKKDILTIAIILSSMGPMISSGVACADAKASPIGIEKKSDLTADQNKELEKKSVITADQKKELEKIKLTDAQLKADDSDIDTWMPNKSVQAEVLKNLILDGVLPADSSVNDITKDLLASDENDRGWAIVINANLGGELTPNLTEGLQYVNDQIKIILAMADASEDKFLKMDWNQLHANVFTWEATIMSPDKIQNLQLPQKIKDAKLPVNTGMHSIMYVQAESTTVAPYFNPTFTQTINLKDQEFFPNINVSESDLWSALQDKDFYFTSFGGNVSRKGNVVAYDLYKFKENSDGSYLGTAEDNLSNRLLMRNIKENPDNFYLTLDQAGTYDDGQHSRVDVFGLTFANFTN